MHIRLYMLCYRVEALVASQLGPEEFGAYMAVGTKKLTQGNVMFFEIDPDLQSHYFKLEGLEQRCVPHPDGAPKRSLYISVYRVLEHLELGAIATLYLVTRDGRVLGIDAQQYNVADEKTEPHLYQELCPVTPLIASSLPPVAFCNFITDPSNAISVPRIFFADMLLDRDETGRLSRSLPYGHIEHIEDCLQQVEAGTGKKTKTVERAGGMEFFYRTIAQGFILGDQTGVKFYPFPTQEQFQREYYTWWRSASMGL